MNLDRGALKVGGDYIMKGNSILQMIKGEDKVHVAGDYATSSTLSHATMLKEGRFELEGNFHQEGQPASFGASGNHTMVLCSQKKEKQLVHFDNKQQSHFARIEITGPGYRSLDTPFGIICGLTDSIILGMQDAVGELLSSPEELLAMAATAAGVELLAAAVPEAALVVTIVFLAVYAKHLADIALNDRSMYEKAREYAREFTLLFLAVQAMRCARNGITTIKNVFSKNQKDRIQITAYICYRN